MSNLKELLRDADPLPREAGWSEEQRGVARRRVLAAASEFQMPAGVSLRSRAAVLGAVAAAAMGVSLLGVEGRSLLVGNLEAAVRLEVRLAEESPAPGLRAARVPGAERPVYLHDEVLVTNSDIKAARVVRDGGPAEYGVSVEFNPAGAERMRAATGSHIGRPVAILLDGQVVVSLVVRSPVGASAVISGKFSRAEAERISQGLAIL